MDTHKFQPKSPVAHQKVSHLVNQGGVIASHNTYTVTIQFTDPVRTAVVDWWAKVTWQPGDSQ